MSGKLYAERTDTYITMGGCTRKKLERVREGRLIVRRTEISTRGYCVRR